MNFENKGFIELVDKVSLEDDYVELNEKYNNINREIIQTKNEPEKLAKKEEALKIWEQMIKITEDLKPYSDNERYIKLLDKYNSLSLKIIKMDDIAEKNELIKERDEAWGRMNELFKIV